MTLFSKAILALVLTASTALAQSQDMKLAVTTSFHNSGLSDVLLPQIAADLDLEVQMLVVGTGQAIRLGEAGDVDAILVHSRAAEDAFVAGGYGTHRREIMYNDFILIGPAADPAGTGTATTIAQALTAIATAQAPFASRGDDSGTHRLELALWRAAGHDPETLDASWYRATGSGMGATLNTAAGMGAYALTDRASWLNFGNKADLAVLFQGDPALFNQYAYLPVSPDRHPHVKTDLAIALEDWLTSAKGQSLIGAYTIDGETLFTPNAVAQ